MKQAMRRMDEGEIEVWFAQTIDWSEVSAQQTSSYLSHPASNRCSRAIG